MPGSPRSPMKKRMENGLVELRTGAKNDSQRVQGHDSIDGDVLHPGNKKHAGDGVHLEGSIVRRRPSFLPPPTPVFIDAVDRTIESGE